MKYHQSYPTRRKIIPVLVAIARNNPLKPAGKNKA